MLTFGFRRYSSRCAGLACPDEKTTGNCGRTESDQVDLNALELQKSGDPRRYRALVLDDENAPVCRDCDVGRMAVQLEERGRRRQKDVERRAAAGLALGKDHPAMRADELIADGQAEARARGLGRKERLEYVR